MYTSMSSNKSSEPIVMMSSLNTHIKTIDNFFAKNNIKHGGAKKEQSLDELEAEFQQMLSRNGPTSRKPATEDNSIADELFKKYKLNQYVSGSAAVLKKYF